MSVVNNNLLLTADAGVAPSAYQISRSLRFNSADSAYLNRTPSVAGNRKTWTWAGWVKRTVLGTLQTLFESVPGGSDFYFMMWFTTNNELQILSDAGASPTTIQETSVALFRDTSAWMHIVLSVDTTQATAANRIKIYLNGVDLTLTKTITPSQNYDTYVNFAGQHTIGYGVQNPFAFNGYLADVHFIDGQALTPSSFTETNATTGQLVPKAYTGTYGTNGFKLNFSDNSAATAATLGADSSGNGNNWTPNNLSVTAGAGNDSLTDTPTSYGTDTGAGGEVRGNYATLNPLSTLTTVTLANGNLDYSSTTASRTTIATIGVSSGQWYWEVSTTAGTTETQVGIYGTSASTLFSLAANSTVYGIRFNANTGALDRTSDGITFTSIATGLTSGPYFPYFNNNGTTAKVVSVNFGQRPFAYVAPSGFKALCDTNLSTPTIAKGSSVFDTTLYTGTGAALTPTSSLAFSPDLVWIKGRSGATDHALYDTVRGTTLDIVSNSSAAETTQAQGLTAFNSNGFSVGTLGKLNTSAATYAGWAWDAGTSTVTNTAGSITSQVRANASAGFSVVTFTGTGANATVGHGLGVAPSMVIVKRRDTIADWQVRHVSVAAANSIQLNLANAAAAATTVWNSTAPSSTVFSIGTSTDVNASAGTYVAYCFAPVTGYSSFGSYTGNANLNGPFVYTGFKPRWVVWKKSSATSFPQWWALFDSSRIGYNSANNRIWVNVSNAESSDFEVVDFLSNGFKIRTADSSYENENGATYIYAGFAENPFQYSRAR
jgi:hypothetical protein